MYKLSNDNFLQINLLQNIEIEYIVEEFFFYQASVIRLL